MDTPPQSAVAVPELEQLARGYCTRAAPQVHGRIAAIKHLLQTALVAYGQRGNPTDAELITELLFPDPAASPPPGPGVMLKQAMQRRGVTDEKKFRDDRRRAFAAFAEFLLVFGRETVRKPSHRRTWAITTAAGFTVLLAAGAAIWLSTRHNPQSHNAAPGSNPSPGPTTTTTNPPPAPDSTHPETVNAGVGARTYRDPGKLTGEGPRIDNRRTVQVSCKIIATSAPSAGLYWYRIVDQPWGNQYYSPANSFLNGDPPTGPYTHEIDEAIPDCPP